MGTRGLYAYRHRGKYYVKYNHCDSYPDGLGRDLVAQIPKNEKTFKAWIEKLRAYYDQEQLRIEKLLGEGEKSSRGSPNGYFGYYSRPSRKPPSLDLFIEWVYVFDLDRMAFSVDNGARFKLDNMPRRKGHPDWVDYLAYDGARRRCLSPTTPREYIADLSPETPQLSEDGIAVYDDCQPKLVASSELASQSMDTSEELALGLAKDFIINYYSFFSNVAKFEPSDREFSHAAAGLLYVTSPGLTFIPADTYPNAEVSAAHPFIVPSSKDGEGDSDGFKFPVSRTGNAFKIPHRQFWYRGRLIRLSSQLHIEENLKDEVGIVVKAIRTRAVAECVAILLSVRHVVFVTITGNDIARTEPIPIMDAFGHGTLEMTLERLSVGLRLLVQFLRPPVYDNDIISRPSLSLQRNELPAKAALPLDVVTYILRFVDGETYARCSSLSRTYRAHCISHPRVGRYTLIRHKEGNCYIARVSNGPNMSIKVLCSAPRPTDYPVYIRYAEGHYLMPLTLSKASRIVITVTEVSEEGEDQLENEEAFSGNR